MRNTTSGRGAGDGTSPSGASIDVRPHGSSPAPLSVLDLSVVGESGSPTEALRQTTALAQEAERWGYRRFWVSEHHSFPAFASPTPAVLLAHLGSVTDRIRLGSGGVMLTNHAPLVVAEQFGVLAALHPGRVDLGVGRAPGALPTVAQALRRGAGDSDTAAFEAQVSEVRGFLGTRFPQDHPYSRDHVHVVPAAPDLPLWVLGSGVTGALVAARLGLPFAVAYHINPDQALNAVDVYRNAFRPSPTLRAAHLMVSAHVICAESEAEALSLARPGALMLALARQGKPTVVSSPGTALRHPYTADEREFVDRWLDAAVHGTPDAVRAGLTDLQRRTGADELMLTSLIPDFTARKRSFALTAREFALAGDRT